MLWKKKRVMPQWEHIGEYYRGKRVYLLNGFIDHEYKLRGVDIPRFDRKDNVWAVNGLWALVPQVSLGFEMHDLGGPSYDALGGMKDFYIEDALKNAKIPVFMPREVPGFVNVLEYPLSRVMKYHGLRAPYFGESLNYCIAFAAMFGVRELVLITGNYPKEVAGERASTEFWCGVAKGRGIRLTKEGNLFRADKWEDFYKPNQYGYRV